MATPSQAPKGPAEEREYEPSRPGIKFALCVAGVLVLVVIYIVTHT